MALFVLNRAEGAEGWAMHHTLMWRRPARARRAAAVAAAVLGVAADALVAPAASQAARCSPGEFCMWSNFNEGGGLYHHAGSDANLWNDRFENSDTGLVVANSTLSFRNRGTSAGPAQVRVFAGINGTGAFTCAPQGSRGNFRFDPPNDTLWKNEVESFEWRSFC